MGTELLYIHPSGHLNDLAVPVGAVGCLNAVTVPRLGRYAFEVTDEEIQAARVVAMDLHWSVGLPGFERLARHVRTVNPRAVQVVGGITAGHYAGELISECGVDHVLKGDSEVSFAALVEAILNDGDPEGIPNVFSRKTPEPLQRRMTSAEYDATDSLTIDWFPTFEKVANWDVAAFGQGRTLGVLRGCPMRCPPCYGSFASTFGRGYLQRSPESLVRELKRAESLGVENLRLIMGKPTPAHLSSLTAAMAEAGPFRFGSNVGFYLCTPPGPTDITALDHAFANPVAISVVPPEEHVPPPGADVVEREVAAWHEAARLAARSRWIQMDVWAVSDEQFGRLRRDFRDADARRVKVSYAAVWHVTRAGDPADTPFQRVREAMEPVWTFYMARLLSPPLAALLEPFRYLDEMDRDPSGLPNPGNALTPFHRVFMDNWRRHKMPTLPGLTFHVVPVRLAAGSRLAANQAGTRFKGALRAGPPGTIEILHGADPVKLSLELDHDGIRLTGPCPRADDAQGVAFVPDHPDPAQAPSGWRDTMASLGLAVLTFPRGTRPNRGANLRLTLRVQDLTVAILDESGDVLCRGRADLGYFHPRVHQPGGDFEDGPDAEHGATGHPGPEPGGT
ncbi:MAG: radical SAM protein [Deltaproteobacteria bacterium]|nr:radical SAM protein [Deltaproteobacteria bacterium]